MKLCLALCSHNGIMHTRNGPCVSLREILHELANEALSRVVFS
jgi:hypothetical protein